MWICPALKFFHCGKEYFVSFTASSASETAGGNWHFSVSVLRACTGIDAAVRSNVGRVKWGIFKFQEVVKQNVLGLLMSQQNLLKFHTAV